MPEGAPVRLCLFDAYGTLFDVHSAAAKVRDEVGDAWGPLSAAWRSRQLHYTWLRSLMQVHADFRQVTGDALDHALEVVGLSERDDLRARLLRLYDELDAYDDVVPALTALREAGVRTAILSNGSPDMLRAVVDHAGLGAHLDALLSVEAVGVFKPDPRVYALGRRHFGIPPSETVFTTANAWDAHGASQAGLRVVWCNRFGQPRERLPGAPAAEVGSLSDLAGWVTERVSRR